jgi:hypothetical protein
VDFPGAVDTGLEDVNDYGNLSGVFDLGDQTTNIGFTNIHGSFLSFEDPSAAPMQTSAGGMNALGFIAGNYVDPSGSTHGFVRTPTGQFDNFDFPGADTTLATRLNDYGQAVGQYFTNFPSHGFLLNGATALNVPPSPCQLLSFDYPNSQNSATRGVNNRGQVSGFYRVWGDPARHGFLATPASGDGGDGNNSCASTLSLIGRGSVNFASFDYPGSANTQATAITPSEEIVGRYFSADGKQHGFILRRGQFQAVDVPQAFFTDVTWVNARGDIVGSYADAIGSHAYVLSGGKVTTIDFPGGNVNLTGFGISNAGDVVGVKSVGSDFLHGHGYLFSRGALTQIDVPGAQGTFPTMILDPSRIVGAYVDSDSLFHGFVLTNGQFRTIDFPNSTFTWITGISPEGDLVGFYNSQDGVQHGFVQRDGKFISVDVPGASSTEGNGINAQGNVVGRYISADGKTHGYFFECVTCQNHGAKGQMNGFRVQILSGPLRFMQKATIERRTN